MNLGPTEILLILLVIVLLFGAKKLPELARGSGQALRIFKKETKGLMDDDDGPSDPHGRPMGALGSHQAPPAQARADAGSTAPVDETGAADRRA